MTFYWKFVDTLVYNVATICAIIVGVTQFAIRAFNENNGKEKVRNLTIEVLNKIDTAIEFGKSNLETAPVKVTKTKVG
jgi:hypothetical protein